MKLKWRRYKKLQIHAGHNKEVSRAMGLQFICRKVALAFCFVLFSFERVSLKAEPLPPACLETGLILGDWSGTLTCGVAEVTLVLHIQQNPIGVILATIDILEQRVLGTPVDSFTFDHGIVKFEIKAASAQFEGLLIKNNSKISGQWIQAGQSFPLKFERGIKSVQIPKRSQEPKRPLPYVEEEVSFDNHEAGITLSGTLTLPASNRFAPVVILIAGSGPNDRDETLLGHKPFLVLADHLTRQGIAVLRFDKRGSGKSTGSYETATTQDFARDVRAGIKYLKSRKDVNAKQLGLIGHSEGGLIAPIVAAQSKDVAFTVLMAGPGVNGEKILYEQSRLIQKALGAREEMIDLYLQFQKELFAIVKKEPDLQIAKEQLDKIAQSHVAILEGMQEKVTLENLQAQIARLNTRWFHYFLTFDPTIALKQMHTPVLVLNGDLDLQVSSAQNLPVIAKALKESQNRDYKIVELPNINHLFQTCETGSISEYAKIEETIAPSVLNLISEWILAQTIQRKSRLF